MKQEKQPLQQASLRPLLVLLGTALLVRIVLICVTPGYPYDQTNFFAWADRMTTVGPADFYAPGYWADYPPGSILLLWGVGWAMDLFHLALPQKGALVLMALPTILCDLGMAVLVWRIGRRYLDDRRALWLAAFIAWNPALIYDTAVWKQLDGLLCFFLLAAFWLLEQQKMLPAAFLYGVALSMKPQALLLGPILALCFLRPLLPKQGERQNRVGVAKAVGQGIAGALVALIPLFLSAIPFAGIAGAPELLWKNYASATQNYPYATVNACNLMGALGGNWVQQDSMIGLLFSWKGLGTALLVLLSIATLALAVIGHCKNRFSPLVLAAFYLSGIFALAHRMHERYLILGLILLIAAAARWNERRLLGVAAAFSVTTLLNQAMVYSQVGTKDEFLQSAASSLMFHAVSIANAAAFLVLAVVVCNLVIRDQREPFCLPQRCEKPEPPLAQPKWTKQERLCLMTITLATALISFWDLGDYTAPQTVLDGNAQPVRGSVQVQGEAREVWVYSQISGDGTLLLRDSSGAEAARIALGHTNTFCWTRADVPSLAEYQVEIENGAILEMAFRDEAGHLLAVTGDAALAPALDEQMLVPDEISYRNSMYFDEIYHGRTAYEQLHHMPIYEITHPPLGKVLIMLGISLFGMTGFGWRCVGAAFGVAMVPVLYLLARRLTRRPHLACAAAVLFALDGFRLAQSRIATIDVYGTFFILLSAYFMVWYAQSVLEHGVNRSVMPMALCGLSFGLGAASKWTGIYAGSGLAVLYFAVLWMRAKQKKPGFRREFLWAMAGGVLFFVLVPFAVYYGSYFVYRWQNPAFGFGQWWQNQLGMFSYHKDLESVHSFASNWYTWPLMLRPVWYYMGTGLNPGQAAGISGMGNPIVWWASSAAVLWLFWQQCSGKGTRPGGAVTVLYLTQLLPWMLVPRCTFLYHYFPSLVFAILALVLWLGRLWEKHPKAARRLMAVLLALSGITFLFLLPAVNGMTIPVGWAHLTRWLPSWQLYAL